MKLAVFGFGNVGRVLSKYAIASGAELTAIADSSGVLLPKSSSSFTTKELDEFSTLKSTNSSLKEISQKFPETIWLDIESYIADLKSPETNEMVLADCSAYGNATTYLLPAQEKNIPIALANKKPLSSEYSHFNQLNSNPSLIRMESTCGAGLPTISTLQRLLQSQDKIAELSGSLSGSLNYLMSSLESGGKFSETVFSAKEQGFLEPDPRDDLSGLDVARKAVILARILGSQVTLDDLTVESLYPDDMADLSVDEFMQKLPKLDGVIKDKVEQARGRNKVLRYLAKVENVDGEIKVTVGLEEVDKDSVLGRLKGTNNCLVYTTESYPKGSELVIMGPGAGLEVTAQGVLADAWELVKSR
eukprot:augustus_masked-scaffold_37-processed-gene-1.42-mRNA-1 protein AED:0.00 eAED:0.00 QI:0/-1/0/1/-1/1/1/0/359